MNRLNYQNRQIANENPAPSSPSRVTIVMAKSNISTLPGMPSEELASRLTAAGVIAGTGVAYSAGVIQSSKTLGTMGDAHEISVGGVRVSLSRFSTLQDLTNLLGQLKTICRKISLPASLAREMLIGKD